MGFGRIFLKGRVPTHPGFTYYVFFYINVSEFLSLFFVNFK
jgi:hypothetical protein